MITLRTKLIVTLLTVALMPLGILAFLNKNTTESVLNDNANQALFAIASQTAISVDTFLETNLNAVRVAAVMPGLATYLSLRAEDRRGGTGDEATALAVLRALSLRDTMDIDSYALLDLEGRNILDTQVANIGQDESSHDYFQRVIESHLPYVSAVTLSAALPVMVFSSPIRDANNAAIGVLRLRCKVNFIQQIIARQTELAGPKSFAILLDEHHIRLAHGRSPELAFRSLVPLAPDLVKRLQAERRLPDRPIAELSTELSEFDDGVRSVKNTFLRTRMDETDDGMHAAALARLKTMPWTVAFVQPEEVFLAPIAAQTRTALLFVLLIASVVTVVAILVGQLLTRPIIHLAQTAGRLAGGNLDVTVRVRSRDEMGTLAQAFNQMARQLRESFATLERANVELEARVQQRTAELKEAKVVAETANKAKGDFLANMSHELRTPLNGVLGYAQILRRSKRIDAEDLRGLDIIFQSGSHLLALINDILDLSKIESQKMELDPSDFQLPSFLRSTVEICRIRSEQKGIAFVYNPVPPLPENVHADGRRLRQILLNLLGNAVKFTEKGSITLTVATLGEEPLGSRAGPSQAASGDEPRGRSHRIRFQIEDTGCGIDQHELGQIFQAFKQTGRGKRHVEGTGLGLAISQRLAKLMGSCIEVRSEPGKGSTFWMDVSLPGSSTWTSPATLAPAGVVTGYHGRRRKVMVVDDNPDNRAVVASMLGSLGFEVMEASNGQEGLSHAAEHRFDLVITDLAMPIVDGIDLMQRVRSMPELGKVAIFASSASAFSSDRQRSLNAGADEFIPKPLQMDELLDKVQRHLELVWIYEPQEGAPVVDEAGHDPDEGSSPIPSDIVFPPAEELAVLLDLTRKGFVNELRKHVSELDQHNAKLAPFTKHLRRLLSDYRLDELEEFMSYPIGKGEA